MVTQNEIVLKHLRNATLTRLEAVDLYGITELNTRICNLRADGHIISSTDRVGVNRYGRKVHFCEYKLIKEANNGTSDSNKCQAN